MGKQFISFVSKRDFGSTQDTTDGDVVASIVVGNIRLGDPAKTVSGNSKLMKKFTRRYIGKELRVPVYHCYGVDSKTFRNGCELNIKQYRYFDNLFCSTVISGKKIIALSGFYPDETIMDRIVKKEQLCDILIFNSMIKDNIIDFPLYLYRLIGSLKPSLIIFGDVSKTKMFEFPLFETKSMMIGYDAHVLYSLKSGELYKKID